MNILGSFAEFEADIRLERQMEGIAKAKAARVYRGRKASIDSASIRAALKTGDKPAHVAKRLGIARSSVYRLKANQPA